MGVEFEELERFLFYDSSDNADQIFESIETNVADGNNVKHSLKSKILERRQSLGLGHITVDFSPKQLHPMTEDEKTKERKRKESNRVSAKRCRKKQKEEYEKNKTLLEQLKDDQNRLLYKVRETEEEKNKVLFALKKILPDSYIIEALKKINYQEFKGKRCRKGKLEFSTIREQSQTLSNTEPDIAASYISTSKRDIFEEDCIGDNASLFPPLINDTDNELQTSDNVVNVEIENDFLLSLFT